MSGGDAFLEELRKRGVARAGLLYAGGAFALVEFADIAFPRLGLPDGAIDAVLWLGFAGFPLVLLASWAIDLRAPSDGGRTRRWLSPATVVSTAILVALGFGMGAVWGRQEPSPGEAPSAAGGGHGPALAVLGFSDLSSSGDFGYFALGLSEEISTALSRFPGLRVISPNATSYFDDAADDLSRLDEELGVRYLLRGSVRRDARQTRISAQLIDSSTGSQLWAESYGVELVPSELFATQEQIARRIASTVGDTTGVVAHLGRAAARRSGTHSLEAYDCVLLGQSYFKVHTAEVHSQAIECLERAVEIDPNYAEAWAHLANQYREATFHGWLHDSAALERAETAAKRAITLDGSSAMAYYALALTLFDLHQFDAAVAAAERALALSPNDSALAAGLSLYLALAGRPERALALTYEVERLNPLHPGWIHVTRALVNYEAGDFEKARSELAAGEVGSIGGPILAASYGHLGLRREARETWRQVLQQNPRYAADPVGQLRHHLFRDSVVERVAEGLRLSGIGLEER